MDKVTLATVLPQKYIRDQTSSYRELGVLASRNLLRTWKIGNTRFYLRSDLIKLGYKFEVAEDRDIPLSELMSRSQVASHLGLSTVTVWKLSDYRGGNIKTVRFNQDTGRFWIKESVNLEHQSRKQQG